jgi:apolipoprotein N-acyltransferase
LAFGGIAATAMLCAYESQIVGWRYLVGFFGFVPWLLVLNRCRTLRGALASGLVMVVAFVAAVFAWFGAAMAEYSAAQALLGFVVLLVAAPFLQPQVAVFAVARHFARGVLPAPLAAVAGCCVWVATEWMFPKLLADNLAHGIYPSVVLRQGAAFAGTAGLTFAILLVNECVCAAVSRARLGAREFLGPLAAAFAIVAALTAYGYHRLAVLAAAAKDAAPVRVALVQANIAGYERLRREMGAYEAVRLVLDTHFSLSRSAVAAQRPETVFPTTFGSPKSDAGAELDREIRAFVDSLAVPLVFGSYDRDAEGEYNSAVFLGPGVETAGVYRKTRLFLFTEYLPRWMDTEWVRTLLPWAGAWTPGPGARVLPLALADGRVLPVAPLICLDDVDPGLAIDGARLGARAFFSLSNDSWFAGDGGGARLHLVVAAFRSIETGLPQMRVTNNGISAVVTSSGEVLESAPVGDRRVLVAEVPPASGEITRMVAWGDWFGWASALASVLLLALGSSGRFSSRTRADNSTASR